MYTYDTLSQATNGLKARGYILDFNLSENCLICQGTKFDIDDFEITESYRFEGDSDPADQAAVYAVEGKSGEKGLLVTGYGISAEGMSAAILKKLQIDRN